MEEFCGESAKVQVGLDSALYAGGYSGFLVQSFEVASNNAAI